MGVKPDQPYVPVTKAWDDNIGAGNDPLRPALSAPITDRYLL